MVAKANKSNSQKAIVLAKATRRAAEHLAIKGPVLSEIIGVSTASISRAKTQPERLLSDKKSFELAAMFVRLFRSLDALTGGDDATSRSWLCSENNALRGRPIDLIQSVEGLMRAVMYVDTRRAKI